MSARNTLFLPETHCEVKNFSKLIWEKCELEFKVDKENFNKSQTKIGDYLSSPIFPNGDDVYFKWQLEFYPLGKNAYMIGYYSSIFLILVWKKIKKPTSVVLNLEIKTEIESVAKFENKFTYEENCKFGHGKCQFYETDKLTDLKGNFIIIRAQVDANYEAYSCLTSNFTSERKLLRNLSGLLENGTFSDAVICVNGTQFKVHRAILASRSDVFAAMFSNEMSEKLTGEVFIDHITDTTMKNLLKFIYGCEVNFKELDETLDLLEASNKYNLEDLKLQCAEYLLNSIDELSATKILLNADRYDLMELKDAVLKYIRENSDQFSDGVQYQILKTNPDLLIDVIKKLST